MHAMLGDERIAVIQARTVRRSRTSTAFYKRWGGVDAGAFLG